MYAIDITATLYLGYVREKNQVDNTLLWYKFYLIAIFFAIYFFPLSINYNYSHVFIIGKCFLKKCGIFLNR